MVLKNHLEKASNDWIQNRNTSQTQGISYKYQWPIIFVPKKSLTELKCYNVCMEYRHKMIKIFAKLGSNKSYTWYIWGERNRRLKLNETLSWVSIFHKVIEDAKAFSFSVNLTLRVDFSSKNWQPYQGTEVPERLRLPDGIISELFY